MENVSAMAVDTVTMETPAPKHKWLAKGSRLAKKAVLAATTFGVMGATCATQAFAASIAVPKVIQFNAYTKMHPSGCICRLLGAFERMMYR